MKKETKENKQRAALALCVGNNIDGTMTDQHHLGRQTTLQQRRRRKVNLLSTSGPMMMSLLQLLLFITSLKTTQAQSQQLSDNFYCGSNWPDAAKNCHRHCPSGEHSECADLGVGWQCFQFTGCYVPPVDVEDEDEDEDEQDVAASNQYCGESWIYAMANCKTPCPTGRECTVPGERCYAATGCERPLVELTADMMVTMMGPDTLMADEDIEIFIQTMYETLQAELEAENMFTEGVDFTGQNSVARRDLEQRYSGRNLKGWQGSNVMISNVTQRMLPVGSSALDASIVVTGGYRPPPYKDLDVIAEDSINRQGQKVVSTLRERGERAGRDFFNRVDGIEAVTAADLTERPTRSPTGKPTPSPTGPPTPTPSMTPSSEPSSTPSSTPSRDLDQMIMTGSTQDLQLGGKTTSSYGYIFNIRTPKDGPTIVIKTLDFYTERVDDVNYEVWSKLGSFQGYKGNFDEWDLVAKGTIKGKGIGRYTPIPEESFTPLSIPGGGGEQGTRAIYITLDEKSLIYKIGEGVYADEVIQVSTEDVELWEGESVLSFPFPDAVEYPMFYRYPRQFLGAIHIDRLPCKPFSLYGPVFDDLPCPRVPTGSPTLPMPTKSPVTDKPTLSPLTPDVTRAPQAPTRSPTVEPTSSKTPTYSPSEPEPTASPIISTKAHFISVFRNVPPRPMNEREEEKFKQILLSFLQKFTEDSFVIEELEIWHQKPVLETDLIKAKDKSKGISTNRSSNRRNEELTQVYSLEVTVIMSISYFFLPSNLLGSMAAETIDGNQDLLLGLLRGQNSFYGYFKQMDNIDTIAIDSVTNPPTVSPITQAQALEGAIIATDVSEEAPPSSNFAAVVGVSIAALWCCLTVISVTYVLKRRGEMEEMKDMENLLAQEKQAKPIMADTAWKKPGSAKGDEEAPLTVSSIINSTEDKVTGTRRKNDSQASIADRSSVSASTRAPASRKSSHVASVASIAEESDHASTNDASERRASRKTSLRNSLNGSGLRSSLTELKGSLTQSVRHVSRGVEAVRRDGVVRSSRRSSTRHSSTVDRRRSSAMSMGSVTSNGSVARSTTSKVRRSTRAGSVRSSNASVTSTSVTSSRRASRIRKSSNGSVTSNSVTSSRRMSSSVVSDRKRERASVVKEKTPVGAAL
jgi:hypothetical protein